MTEHLQGLPNHRKVVDDNLIFSKDAAAHAQQVRTSLQRRRKKGIRLSEEKFHYMHTSIGWFPTIITRLQDSGQGCRRHKGLSLPRIENGPPFIQWMANQLAPTNEALTKALSLSIFVEEMLQTIRHNTGSFYYRVLSLEQSVLVWPPRARLDGDPK